MLNKRYLSGVSLVLISAAAFGAMPVFARVVYASGSDPVTLLFLRFTFSGFLMLAITSLRGVRFPRGKTLLGLVAMGGIGYVGQSLCYFNALTMASAGLVALLLYLYPALVTVLSAAIFKERITNFKAAALVLALAGAVLTIGPAGQGKMLGYVLGISAAAIYAVYLIAGGKLMQKVQPLQASTVIMASAAVVFGGLAAWKGIHLPQDAGGWGAILALSVISTVLPIVTLMAGIERVGSTNAATISTIEPAVTVVLAAMLLNESLTLIRLIGGGLILTAVILLSKGEKANDAVVKGNGAIKSPTPG